MRSDIECLSCVLKQAFNTVRLATKDKEQQREVMNRTADWIQKADLALTPAALSTVVYRIVSEVTGVQDPYEDLKRNTNSQAMALLPNLRPLLSGSDDPLSTAIHLAAAGNIIDFGIGHEFDLEADIRKILKTQFAIDDTDDFREQVRKGGSLLYLSDNSGEIVLDGLLAEWLQENGVRITIAVKSHPVINDVTIEDAEQVGLARRFRIIETGSGDIGIDFGRCSQAFLRSFEQADLILAKGHGNFESCCDRPESIFFLLKAKCAVVAQELGIWTGELCFVHKPAGMTIRERVFRPDEPFPDRNRSGR